MQISAHKSQTPAASPAACILMTITRRKVEPRLYRVKLSSLISGQWPPTTAKLAPNCERSETPEIDNGDGERMNESEATDPPASDGMVQTRHNATQFTH